MLPYTTAGKGTTTRGDEARQMPRLRRHIPCVILLVYYTPAYPAEVTLSLFEKF